MTDDAHPSQTLATWEWCGACAGANRELTEEEAHYLLASALGRVDAGESARTVLASLSWTCEMHGREKCRCVPREMVRRGIQMKPPFPNAVSVYRLFDDVGTLLYVGKSVKPWNRYGSHLLKPWGRDICRWSVEWHADENSALLAELVAIRDESPLYNKQGRVT